MILLTIGTTNAYIAGAVSLTAALSRDGAAPAWLAGPTDTWTTRGLLPIALLSSVALTLLALGAVGVDDLVRRASTLFVTVYAAGTAAGVRLLTGRARRAALTTCALVLVALAFSGPYLAVSAAVTRTAERYHARRQRDHRQVQHPRAANEEQPLH